MTIVDNASPVPKHCPQMVRRNARGQHPYSWEASSRRAPGDVHFRVRIATARSGLMATTKARTEFNEERKRRGFD